MSSLGDDDATFSPACRRKSEIITTVVVWLLLGAIVNVAVAWGIAARTDVYSNPVTLMSKTESRAFITSRIGAASDDGLFGMRRSALGATLTAVPYSRPDAEMITYAYLFDWRYGWPVRSLMTDVQPSAGRPQSLPVRPIWPGFAINTVFYAGMLWLLFTAPFAMRRRRRIKRGLCPKCAYDLRGRDSDSTACPECGHRPG